jgi:hypothetical protein
MPSLALILAYLPDQVGTDSYVCRSAGALHLPHLSHLHSGSTRADYRLTGYSAYITDRSRTR